ncbi:MAG: sigma-54 dependent transcriptional regulator [Longimicrobiales bacterium]|nr:sigma-54 dependent transcriptional regulator [Longimicrobiales bacterium]
MVRPSRLLVVDDEPALRSTLRSHLSDLGHQVLAVESGTAALNRIGAFDPDIVLTDVRMPGIDGFELLDHVKELRPCTDVVIFTGHGDVEGAIEAIKRGASDYLVKPLDLDETDEIIRRCLQKRQSSVESEASEPRPVTVDPAHGLVGEHPSMMHVYKTIGAVANTEATVLIRGETGTGKELVARAIHRASDRASAPFVAVNCAAVPEDLLESELFGHVRGAFTGASMDRRGKFETAGNGTLFLDEIGDTTLPFQAKLLRVLQEKEFYPVGSDQPRRTQARFLTATHRPLEEMVERGSFRADLLYRLQVIEIPVAPLRERRGDIPKLARHFLFQAASEAGVTPPVIPPAVMEELAARPWPGNVRELRNVMTRAVVLSRGPSLTVDDVGGSTSDPGEEDDASPEQLLTLAAVRAAVERRHVQQILRDTDGNKSQAARVLGVSRPTLNRIIRDHDLVVP